MANKPAFDRMSGLPTPAEKKANTFAAVNGKEVKDQYKMVKMMIEPSSDRRSKLGAHRD